MAGIPPFYQQNNQSIPPAQQYSQYVPQYPPPPPPPQYNLFPPKPQRPIRTKILYRDPPKPSNNIFIKNIPYDLSDEEFKQIYSKFGEIYSITNHIKNRGMAFITYYNIKSAIDAVEQMGNVKIHDRPSSTRFSFKPPPYSRIDPKATSTIVEVQPIQPNQANQVLNQGQVSQVMSKYGQIYHIQEIEPNHITVQYYDLRNAKDAAESAPNIDIGGIKCKVELYVEPPGEAIIQPVIPPQQYPPSRVPPGPPPPPPSQLQMPPSSYPPIPPSYQQPPPQQMQMPIHPPPPPPSSSQYNQQMQIPQYAPPQQMQYNQYGGMPPLPPPPPPPPSQPNQPQSSGPQSSYQSYSPNQSDMTSSLLSSVLE